MQRRKETGKKKIRGQITVAGHGTSLSCNGPASVAADVGFGPNKFTGVRHGGATLQSPHVNAPVLVYSVHKKKAMVGRGQKGGGGATGGASPADRGGRVQNLRPVADPAHRRSINCARAGMGLAGECLCCVCVCWLWYVSYLVYGWMEAENTRTTGS